MNDLPGFVFCRWWHSFEEDQGEVCCYRPDGYPFPRARGRASLEFFPHGVFIDWPIGPADKNLPHPGHWQMTAHGRVRLFCEGTTPPPRLMEMVAADPQKMLVRWHAA